ncbi:MAG TPA: tol-pal system-associated acyl-CoA thioesterase [Methylococcaceae bacterium]|nr:tol-pal system-associated acyl-CoA thioesterase [Methylococcaceae bacterium]
MTSFSWQVRVYYEDTDAGGVVYYANYLKFFERARTEYLRALGFEQDALRASYGILFAVKSVAVDYRAPARFNDLLWVSAELTEFRRASFSFAQALGRVGESEALCTAAVRIACLDAVSFRPRPMPDQLSDYIKHEF